jgi:hypothetical protein
MKTEVEFRSVPDFPGYEVNRQSAIRRRLPGGGALGELHAPASANGSGQSRI